MNELMRKRLRKDHTTHVQMQLASMIDCSQHFKCFCVKISPAPQDLGSGQPFQILAGKKSFASKGVELSISEIDGGTHEGARAAIKWSE